MHPAGARDYDAIFRAVGHALWRWETFEASLADLFTRLVRPRERVILERGYGSLASFKGRIDMVKAAMAAHLVVRPDPDLAKLFKDFAEMAEGFSARRNDIAHGWAMMTFGDSPAGPTHHYYLLPALYSAKGRTVTRVPREDIRMEASAYAYNPEDIDFYALHFADLTTLTQKLGGAVRQSQVSQKPKRR